MINSSLIEYIKAVSELDEPLGDFAGDIFRDKNFPFEGSEKEMINYLRSIAEQRGRTNLFQQLIEGYKS